MGRKKLKIKTIENEKQKHVTFSRRCSGLIKKAHELSVLCDRKVVLLMFDSKDACHLYSSAVDHEDLIKRYYNREVRVVDVRKKASPSLHSQGSLNDPGQICSTMFDKCQISTTRECFDNDSLMGSAHQGTVLFSVGIPPGTGEFSGVELDPESPAYNGRSKAGGSKSPLVLHPRPSQLPESSNNDETHPGYPPIIHYPDAPPTFRNIDNYSTTI